MQHAIRLTALLVICAVSCAARAEEPSPPPAVEQWATFELRLDGPSSGNPFTDVTLSGDFSTTDAGGKATTLSVTGFYDGGGVFRIRFMPPRVGAWSYRTRSNRPELDGHIGQLRATKPSTGNHGPVVVVPGTFHFAYADGSRYVPVGTTCYAWVHQGDELEEQTLATLRTAPFNKLRMCVFPKWYDWNRREPLLYPFEGTPPNHWDFSRFNPKFFQHLETRIGQLRDLGIEADVILFHPYDKGHWGFDRMPADADDRYLRYVVARLAAYRNVWWSIANEYDFMKAKTEADFDRFFQIVQSSDPYQHLRSIHNGALIYDHRKPWVTHASIQNGAAVADFGRAELYRDAFRKPVIYDEVKYEGDIDKRWGELSAEEMVHRCWQGAIAGTYVGHGETYRDDGILWWSHGGTLHGQSPPRIAFLRKVLEDAPAPGIDPIDKWQDGDYAAGKPGEYYLIYFGKDRPTDWRFVLYKQGVSEGMKFRAELLDTWNMTITPVQQTFTVKPVSSYQFGAPASIPLPGNPWMAIRLRRVQ